MNWMRIKLIVAGIGMLAWGLYVLMTTPSSSSGYHIPSPDHSMSAKIQRVHSNPTIGTERTFYEIYLYDEYSPGETRVKPIIREEYPLSIAPPEFELNRDCIEWDMKNFTVIFNFDKTKITKTWK